MIDINFQEFKRIETYFSQLDNLNFQKLPMRFQEKQIYISLIHKLSNL